MSTWTVLLPAALRPKRAPWLMTFAGVAVASLAVFAVVTWQVGWSPGSVAGLSFGGLAAGLMVVEVLYAARRRLMIRPLKTGQAWLQVHVYGGTLTAIFVLIHAGFAWPHGVAGFILLGLTLLVTLSGLLGVALQKIIPPLLSRAVETDALFERIPSMIGDLRTEADQTVTGASEVLTRFFHTRVQPALTRPSISVAALLNVRGARGRQLADFEDIRSFLGTEDSARLDQLRSIVIRKTELEAHYTWQTLLRTWLLVHVPAAMLLLAALVAHLAAVWRF